MKYIFIPIASLILTVSQLSIISVNLVMLSSLYWFIWRNTTEAIAFTIISGFILDLLTNIPLGTSLAGFLLVLMMATFFKRTGVAKKKFFIVVFLIFSLFAWNGIVELILSITE